MATDLAAYGLVPLSEASDELRGAARAIPLHAQGGTVRAWAMVDAEDYTQFCCFRWCLNNGYAIRYHGGRLPRRKMERLHRCVLGLDRADARQCDHINGDRLDNRRSNLRVVTEPQNHQNQPVTRANSRTSQHRGVSFEKYTGRWKAQAQVDGTNFNLGRFDTEDEAAAAAAEFRRQHMPFSTN